MESVSVYSLRMVAYVMGCSSSSPSGNLSLVSDGWDVDE